MIKLRVAGGEGFKSPPNPPNQKIQFCAPRKADGKCYADSYGESQAITKLNFYRFCIAAAKRNVIG